MTAAPAPDWPLRGSDLGGTKAIVDGRLVVGRRHPEIGHVRLRRAGGGVALGQPDLLARATERAAGWLMPYIGDYDVTAMSCIVVPPTLKQDAGPLGAILLAARAAQLGTPGVTTGLRSTALRDSAGQR